MPRIVDCPVQGKESTDAVSAAVRQARTDMAADFDAIVIGAGISGFYQLYKLRELGQLRASTANGIARMAPVTLREVRIDQLSYDAPAAVIENLNITLLGMSFLGLIAGLRDARQQTSRSAE